MTEKQIDLVRAASEHSRMIWEWRNDALTRSMFRASEPVPWVDHEKWFKESLCNQSRFLYVGLCNNVPVGVVRFDLIADLSCEFEVSINVAPDARGAGVGRRLMLDGIDALCQDASCLRVVIAEVKEGNAASNALFISTGFLHQPPKECGFNLYKLFVSAAI